MEKMFVGQKKVYQKDHVIVKLTSFIKENPEYFSLFAQILVEIWTLEDLKKRMPLEIDFAINTMIIEEKQESINIFSNLMLYLYEDERNRGKIFEYLMSWIGPFTIETDQFEWKNDCKIANTNGQKISDKNYDTVFYSKCLHINDLEVEFLENKISLRNFLLTSNNCGDSLSKDGGKKLDFFHLTKKLFSKCKKCTIAFVTLQENIDKIRMLLKDTNYSWVEIFTYNDIAKVVGQDYFF